MILHESKEQLEIWIKKINRFLRDNLKIELHPQKSRIISLSNGVDFVGFRNFYYHRLLRKRSLRNMLKVIEYYEEGIVSKEKIFEVFQGWQAYAKWADSFKLRNGIVRKIMKFKLCKLAVKHF